MKILSIFAGHDANITFSDTDKGKYHIIEIERLVKKRYFRLHADNSKEFILEILSKCKEISEKFWGFENDWDFLSFVTDGLLEANEVSQIFKFKDIKYFSHQLCHAASTFYQSGFNKSLIISFDGGGDDGFFNVFLADEGGVNFVDKVDCDFGGAYMLLASCITEITKSSSHQLALPGKMMGLCAYGKPDLYKSLIMRDFFIDRDYKKVSELGNYDLLNVDKPWGDGSIRGPLNNYKFEGQNSYDFAATSQLAFEDKFIELLEGYLKKHPVDNICLTGGGALNVLLNQRIKNNFKDKNLFVGPNPNDCGLSLGANFLTHRPGKSINLAYSGMPILDIEKKSEILKNRKTKELDLDYVCRLLKMGKIIGVCRGDSEVGPRALGNRSIICDPSFENMKDILNSKVKFREWFRPFAPFCLKEKADLYFESKDFENFEFMSYAPLVKESYRKKLPSITHIDGTARLQTVTKESHQFFYELLNKFQEYSETNVLLNTSFNIKGFPILTSIEDAIYVLDNTELDCLIIENTIVEK
jgi:predicted NodU family carbamoyl transferase